MDCMTIDDDVLTKISFTFKALSVSNSWLVDRPIIERRIHDWVGELSQSGGLDSGLLLYRNEFGTDFHRESEVILSGGVFHQSWVHKNWNALS